MKRMVIFSVVSMLLAGIIYFAVVPSDAQAMMGKAEHKQMMHKGMKGMMKCPFHMTMMKGMMEKKIVETSDGGVVVMTCDKLYKYDKDLNLVKEVELKAVEDMKEKMGKMCSECMEKCQQMKPMEKPEAEKK